VVYGLLTGSGECKRMLREVFRGVVYFV